MSYFFKFLIILIFSCSPVYSIGASAFSGTNSMFFSDIENFKNKSLNIQTEKQNLKSSEDLLLSKRLFWTPKISISAHQNQTKVNSNEEVRSDYLQADLSWNLFRGGGDIHLMNQASSANKAQELQLLNENLKTEISASDLIFKSIYLKEMYRIQEQLLRLKEESLKIVSDRYHQGKLPLQEVTKSDVDLSQQKNKLRLAQLDVAENRSQILSAFVTEIQTSTWPFSEKTTATLTSSGSGKMPLLEQKYWLSQAQEQMWKSTKTLHWPSLDFQLQYQEASIKTRENSQLLGYLTLSLPLWENFESYAKISSSYAQYINAINDFKNTEQNLKQKNNFLIEKIMTLRTNLSEAKKNLDSSRKLYQDILRSFRLGRLSTNDLFIEQNRLLDSENNFALNQLSFHQSLVEQCVLAGAQIASCLKN